MSRDMDLHATHTMYYLRTNEKISQPFTKIWECMNKQSFTKLIICFLLLKSVENPSKIHGKSVEDPCGNRLKIHGKNMECGKSMENDWENIWKNGYQIYVPIRFILVYPSQ